MKTLWIAFKNPDGTILHAGHTFEEADTCGREKLKSGETFYLREFKEVTETGDSTIAHLANAFRSCGEARSAIRAVMFPDDPSS